MKKLLIALALMALLLAWGHSGAQQAEAQTEACCYPDGSCADVDPAICTGAGGTPQGPGTNCAGVECQAAPTEACCYPDGSCADVDPAICTGAGGSPQGVGTNCAGVECQAPPEDEIKWAQMPDESSLGLDVSAYDPFVLAEDFQCTQSGLITQIDFWASWYVDMPPGGNPSNVAFTLSLHSDVKAGYDLPWSHPGELLWMYSIGPGDCTVQFWAWVFEEGWLEPPDSYIPSADTEIWLYSCPIPEPYWFQQEAGTIYWLDIQAMPQLPGYYFGWKTSIDPWNDDGVWAMGWEPIDPLDWVELLYPPLHPLAGASIDLAFQIWGRECNPLLDSDADTFYDDVECYLPTDFRDDCSDNPGVHDAWPLDNNIDRAVTVVGDVLPYSGKIGLPVTNPTFKRLDLNADASITVVGDVLPFSGNVGTSCT